MTPDMKKILILLLLVVSPMKAEIYDISQLDLKRHQGKVVYLDFWASWCKPCQKSFPWMNLLLTRHPAQKFTVTTVNLDAETETMHQFMGKVNADFDVYHDPGGQMAEQLDVEGLPTSYLIDPSGNVANKHVGFYARYIDKYEREIEALLTKSASAE